MKTYPKVDGKELTKEQKEQFEEIETQILWNKEVLDGTEFENDIKIIAYNSAFCIVTDKN